MIKHGFKGIFFAMAGVLLFGCAAQQMQPAGPLFERDQITAGKYEPKVEEFVVILDASSSMNETYNGADKLKIAKDFLWAMSQTLPELQYNVTLRTFGKYHDTSKDLTEIVYGPANFSKTGFKEGLMAVKHGEGTSHLGIALNAAGEDLKSAQGKIAVVVLSDGKDMSNEPVAAASELKDRFGDRLCIYTVLVGDDRAGKNLLESVATVAGCGISTGADEFKTGQEMAEFVKTVFLADVILPLDSDGDGVKDGQDRCPNTPKGVVVDAKGCPLDSDGDGVPNYLDKCADTPKGVKVDMAGCPLDKDGDGVPDYLDDCPDTPKGASVNQKGCWIYVSEAFFDLNSYKIKLNAYPMLDAAVVILKENPELRVDIQGYTDSTGTASYNMSLSEKRAGSVKTYFVSKGIDPARLSTKGFGESQPAASNKTKEGRAQNRRVQLLPVK